MNVIKDPGLGRREGEEKNAFTKGKRWKRRSRDFEASAIEM
jgi:hypothetical protein